MSDVRKLRRAVVEMDSDTAQSDCAGFGNRSIHQFWHLVAPHFRGVLLAPRRRADNGNVTWGWRESGDSQPLTTAELAEVRLRLSNASRSMKAGLLGVSREGPDRNDGDDQTLDRQVAIRVGEMSAALIAKSDQALAGFACRADSGTMLHSWGATKPGRPVFTDAQPGDVSGTVLIDEAGAAGLGVILENLVGLRMAHAQSDATGAFRFQGIPPGRYRLRVTGRTDFPADGWPLQVERAAVSGLELRGGTQHPAGERKRNGPPAPKRRWLPVAVILLLLAGTGVGLWRLGKRTSARDDTPGRSASGWQAAQGPLAASSDGAAGRDLSPVAGEKGWSELSRSLSDPAKLKRGGQARPASGEGGSPDRRSSDDPSTSLEKQPSEQRVQPAEVASAMKTVPSAVKAETPGRSPSAARPAASATTDRDADASGQASEAPATDRDERPSRSEPSASAGRRSGRPGASAAAVDVVESDELPKGTTLDASETSLSADRKAGAAPAPATVATGNRQGVGAGNAVTGAGATSGIGPRTASTAGPSGTGTNHLASSGGTRRRERSGASDGDGAAVVSSMNTESETPGAGVSPAEEDVPKDKAAAAERRGDKSDLPQDGNVPAAAATPTKAASDDDAARVPATAVPQVARKRGPRKKEAVAGETGKPTAAGEAEGGLRIVAQIKASGWQPRLVRDVILPTLPLAEGPAESLEDLRTALLRTQLARMPQIFREPLVWSGIALEFERDGDAGSPHWIDASGDRPEEGTVQSNRAELAWAGRTPVTGRNYLLRDANGREIARISRDSDGGITLKAAPDVRAWYWLGVEHEPVGRSREPAASHHLSWKHASGEDLPALARHDDVWRAGKGQRLDLPLAGGGPPWRIPLAVVDHRSGWALVGEIDGR